MFSNLKKNISKLYEEIIIHLESIITKNIFTFKITLSIIKSYTLINYFITYINSNTHMHIYILLTC